MHKSSRERRQQHRKNHLPFRDYFAALLLIVCCIPETTQDQRKIIKFPVRAPNIHIAFIWCKNRCRWWTQLCSRLLDGAKTESVVCFPLLVHCAPPSWCLFAALVLALTQIKDERASVLVAAGSCDLFVVANQQFLFCGIFHPFAINLRHDFPISSPFA